MRSRPDFGMLRAVPGALRGRHLQRRGLQPAGWDCALHAGDRGLHPPSSPSPWSSVFNIGLTTGVFSAPPSANARLAHAAHPRRGHHADLSTGGGGRRRWRMVVGVTG
ncbi:MAG: hypothetical protein R2838_03845 [Caldilineaceae bacterium]